MKSRNLATITGGAYLERLNNPTPWSRKMMPHHRNMVRSLCRAASGLGRRLAADPGDRRALRRERASSRSCRSARA